MVAFAYGVNSERKAEPRTPANTLLVGGTSSAFSATSQWQSQAVIPRPCCKALPWGELPGPRMRRPRGLTLAVA